MTLKKKKKEGLYRKIFNALIGEKFMDHLIFLAFGMVAGIMGFVSINYWSEINDVAQLQMFSMITLIYIGVYFYIGLKHIKTFLPMIVYYSIAITWLYTDKIYVFPCYLLIGLLFFALLDELGVYLQRRNKR